jgi:MFS family permease
MSTHAPTLKTIRTDIPARMDRLPWSRFHWRIVIGLGTVWILDGLEVTIVGAIAPRLTEAGSGIEMTAADIGMAGSLYVAGACIGALLFGQLTDRFGRKKLFLLTLALYLGATVATAFAFDAWYFFLCRFLTGMGIGGEYAAINSAIDELIPARNRGQVDIAINGSFWVGAALGALASVFLLETSIFDQDLGWRITFAGGALLGLGIMLVRRHVPESPRWLFIHGREDEAERIVREIEDEVRRETGAELPPPREAITIRQREAIPFRAITRVLVKRYPRRAILGLALFVGQAFLYNAVTFDLGTILNEFFDVSSEKVPYLFVIFAAGNFLGPLVLGRLFDTVGRIPMIAGTYLISAALVVVLGFLLRSGDLETWSFMAFIAVTFFFASAGASSAYLTVSEVFPMETRALAIAFFYAIGTATGGIVGPLVFGQLIHSGSADQVATGFFIGGAVMAIGGFAELLFGVRAEGQSLENIARPLTAEEADGEQPPLAVEMPDATAERIRERADRRRTHERSGLRRVRPGVGGAFYSPGMLGTAGTATRHAAASDMELDAEIEALVRALQDNGRMGRHELRALVAGQGWGPGRFRTALRQAAREGRVSRGPNETYGAGADARDRAAPAR